MTWQLLKKDVVNKEQYMQNVVEGAIQVCVDVHSEVENEASDRGHDCIIQENAGTMQ